LIIFSKSISFTSTILAAHAASASDHAAPAAAAHAAHAAHAAADADAHAAAAADADAAAAAADADAAAADADAAAADADAAAAAAADFRVLSLPLSQLSAQAFQACSLQTCLAQRIAILIRFSVLISGKLIRRSVVALVQPTFNP
jgi:hypothetical protein